MLALLTVILLLRDPQRLLHPVLWGEDGMIWYSDAVTGGVKSLFYQHVGYLCVFPRLAALIGRAVPIGSLPLFFTIVGAAVQIIPAYLILFRAQTVIASCAMRIALSTAYILMPNVNEIYLNLTDTQWHLALTGFLLIVIGPRPGAINKAVHGISLAVIGLTGPFAVFLAPIAAWPVLSAWRTRRGADRRDLTQAAIMLIGAAVQACLIIVHSLQSGRTHQPLHPALIDLIRLLADQVFLAGMFGRLYAILWHLDFLWGNSAVAIAANAVGLGLIGAAFATGTPFYRKFAIFTLLLFTVALASPLTIPSRDFTPWQALDRPYMAARYVFFPILLWFYTVIAMALGGRGILRGVALAMIPLLIVEIGSDLVYPPADAQIAKDYKTAARQYMAAAPGTAVRFPAAPNGKWAMWLVKPAP